ncbi:hypothetical protein Holit_00643 [Hollandina sp. SP2]
MLQVRTKCLMPCFFKQCIVTELEGLHDQNKKAWGLSGHFVNEEDDPYIAAYPERFYRGAGAVYTQTVQVLLLPNTVILVPLNAPISPDSRSSPGKEVLEAIQKKEPGKTALVKVRIPIRRWLFW